MLFLMSLLLIVFLTIAGASLLLLSTSASRTVERQRRATVTFDIAEAGLERAFFDLRQDFVGGSSNWADGTINSTTVDVSNVDTDGYYPLYSSALNGGTYAVRLKNVTGNNKEIWVRSTGTLGDTTQRIQAYVTIENCSIWNNAIFAGAGAAGKAIAGNTQINGSVHILGDNLLPTDYAVSLGGTAELVGNNYNGMDGTLLPKIPALPTRLFGGQTVSTLNAALRVKKGKVGLDGAARVGEPNNTGNTVKETVDATYVTNGFGGNSGTNNVYSDNGWSNPYDMGNSVTFPPLSTEFKDNFRANALVLNSDITITSSSNFSYSNAYGSISANAGTVTVSGRIYIDDSKNLTITGSNPINYTGKASILATGSVTIDTDFVTSGNNSFPQNIVGIMTPNSMNLGVSAQINMMGLFYSEGTITIDKQTDIIGSLVTNYFNMGKNVPKIYQVPSTVNNLPPGMIDASGSSWSLRVVGWQKL